MSKLQILIPQYNEDDNQIKVLLDSIAIQQNINLKEDIEVFIGNDGSDTKLSVDFLKTYKFRIQYHYFEHERLAATRQKLLDLATADYVMFCDADDAFISTIALNLILEYTKTNFDSLICDFLEEHLLSNGRYIYIPHSNDSVFVHGKVYRRQFLLDNQIKWHPELHEHQDSPFNVLARSCSKKEQLLKIPIYIWHDNPKSICRRNGLYHSPNTWPHMIDSYEALIHDFKERGMGQHACYYAKYALYATYYEMSHAIWEQEDVEERKAATLIRLAKFYKKHELLIKNSDPTYEENLSKINKKSAERKGPLQEMPPFDEWLKSILTIYK